MSSITGQAIGLISNRRPPFARVLSIEQNHHDLIQAVVVPPRMHDNPTAIAADIAAGLSARLLRPTTEKDVIPMRWDLELILEPRWEN